MPNWVKNLIAKIIGKRIKKEVDKMEESKKWYASKGVWTGVVIILMAGYNAGAVSFGWPVVPEWVYTLLGAMGIYARKTADTKIS
jgi:hypothetical protein